MTDVFFRHSFPVGHINQSFDTFQPFQFRLGYFIDASSILLHLPSQGRKKKTTWNRLWPFNWTLIHAPAIIYRTLLTAFYLCILWMCKKVPQTSYVGTGLVRLYASAW